MLEVLLCTLIIAIIAAVAYYAAHQWINLRHNRDTLTDELKRAVVHIEDLEARIAHMEAEKSLQGFKTEPQQGNTGWEAFDVRR